MLKNLPNLSLHMLISVMLIKEKTCTARTDVGRSVKVMELKVKTS